MTNGVVFLGVKSAYPPGEDIIVNFELKGEVTTTSRDWLGLFRVGWTSSKEYYTFVWVPSPIIRSDVKVVFTGRTLPPADDGQRYQFGYISRDNVVYGSSTPFTFTTAACDDVIAVDIIDEGAEESSIVELRMRESPWGIQRCVTVECTSAAGSTGVSNGQSGDETNAQQAAERETERRLTQDTQHTCTRDDGKVAAEQMEGLVTKFRDRIDLLEETQKTFLSAMETSAQRLSAENMLLKEWVLSHGGEMLALREMLEKEEYVRAKMEQQLLTVQRELAATKASHLPPTREDNSSDLPGCSTSPSVVNQNAKEALQIAYENIEKYYRASCVELEACTVSLREAEIKLRVAEKRCGELEACVERMQKERDSKAQELTTIKRRLRLGDEDIRVKELEQKVQESENKCALLASQGADREEQYKLKIRELERQLEASRINVEASQKIDTSDQGSHTGRQCPVCGMHFPARMLQTEFERHVQAHFLVAQ